MSSKPALKSKPPQAALLEGGVPEAVVLRAPLGVGEDLVRLAELLEALLGRAGRPGSCPGGTCSASLR